jgi:hypothetical protein
MNRINVNLASACSLAVAVLFIAPGARADGGGKFTETFYINLTNPCNGIGISDQPITVSAVVQVFEGDYAVAVESTFSGAVSDINHGQYRISGNAIAAYNTLSTHYVLPMLLDVAGINGASSFTQLQDTTVNVNPQQSPVSVLGAGVTSTCE